MTYELPTPPKSDLEAVWKTYGGSFHGPIVETASIVKSELPKVIAYHTAALEKERDEARFLNGRAICVYCGYIGPKDPKAMMDHLTSCEGHPIKNAIDRIAEIATEASKLESENTILKSQIEKAEGETERLREALGDLVERYNGMSSNDESDDEAIQNCRNLLALTPAKP